MRQFALRTFLLSLVLLIPFSLSLAKMTKEPDTYSYKRGVEALNADNIEEGEQWLTREIAEHPDNGYAYIYLSTIQFVKDQPGAALGSMKKALKLLPKRDKEWTARAYAIRAKFNEAMGDTVKALEDYAAAVKLNPENTQLLADRADIYFEQNRFDLADADYNRMIQIEPGKILGYMGLGRSALRSDRPLEAISHFNTAVKYDPSYSLAYSFRAEAYTQLGKWHEAADDIIKALEIDGDDKAFYMLAHVPEEAFPIMETKLKVMSKKQPSNSYWPYCMGALAHATEKYDKALEYYKKSYEIEADPLVLDRLAKIYLNLNRNEEALDAISRAIDMQPAAASYNTRADVLEKLGRFEEAIKDRDWLVEQYPDYAQAYLDRAEDLMMTRDFDKALEDYDTALILAPELEESSGIFMKKGDALRLSGKPEEARKEYERMIVLEKDSALTAASWIPFAYSQTGETEKALEAMKFIVASDTTDTIGSLYNLACLYARIDMKPEAVAALRDAIGKGYRNKGHIIGDYDLDPIREMPGFISLMEELDELLPSQNTSGGGEEEEAGRMEIVEVPFTKEYGVTTVKCAVNDLPLHFVFDTGASDVTLSMVEANFMLKNKYIDPADIVGSARYLDANGDVSEGTVINLKKVNFGGLELDNVRASVVRNQKAPLLLGQSVLGRLGKIEIDNAAQKLVISHRVR